MGTGFVNRGEARLVGEIAARLPAEYLGGEGCAVIAPYAAQVSVARQALASALELPARDPWLLDNVATVDSFQGQERDVVLVTLTRANATGAVGFLSVEPAEWAALAGAAAARGDRRSVDTQRGRRPGTPRAGTLRG